MVYGSSGKIKFYRDLVFIRLLTRNTVQHVLL